MRNKIQNYEKKVEKQNEKRLAPGVGVDIRVQACFFCPVTFGGESIG